MRDPLDGAPLWRVRSAPQPPPDALEDDKHKTFWQTWEDRVGGEDGDPLGDAAAAVRSDMRMLDRTLADESARWDSIAPPPPAPPEFPGGIRSGPAEEAADKVSSALEAADTHADTLSAFPEWQKIQTIRCAARHLWDTIRKRAGAR
ncbi:hypothetical protein ACFT9I_29310 [Streptomyces sp. NPDC057137]|uniref:hypothetical protein n=1 Tax=Streptomyces sp. NPDC057137 TaxID=3346030 RepID=UPI00363A9528